MNQELIVIDFGEQWFLSILCIELFISRVWLSTLLSFCKSAPSISSTASCQQKWRATYHHRFQMISRYFNRFKNAVQYAPHLKHAQTQASPFLLVCHPVLPDGQSVYNWHPFSEPFEALWTVDPFPSLSERSLSETNSRQMEPCPSSAGFQNHCCLWNLTSFTWTLPQPLEQNLRLLSSLLQSSLLEPSLPESKLFLSIFSWREILRPRKQTQWNQFNLVKQPNKQW